MKPPRIRVARRSDSRSIAEIYGPYVRDTAISFEADPPTGDEMAARIAATLPTYPYLVAHREGAVVGYAYASKHRERAAYRWSVDVTVYVSQSERRTGVGRALYTPLLFILRKQGFRSAYAGIALPNPGSIGLHEAMGFQPVGTYKNVGYKHGRWHSVGWWGLEFDNNDAEPQEPVPFSSPAMQAALSDAS
jgi:phosphinothricin acetyltransferase